MIGWNFPLNNYGQECGFNDAGIETFKGNPWASLARETIQNSLDAKLPGSGGPIEVRFELYSLPIEEFPGKEDFVSALEACRKYWENSPKAKSFFSKALEVTRQPAVSVLKISDFNTTGLTGSDKDGGTDWHKLIKSVGTSDKAGRAGGSYGLGKHAPFACSLLRTVFYGTKDKDGRQAFQGVAKLVTHLNREGEPTQGTGYYGVIEKNRPVTDMSLVSPFFQRSEVGTDLFVFGFNSVPDWQARVVRSVIEHFFVAIIDGNLVIRVGDILIDADSLPVLIDRYISQDPECLSGMYCEAYQSPDARCFRNDNFENMGQLDLFVLPKKDFPKKVAMVRETGMKIFDKGHFHTPVKFAGVLIARGDKLNEFLRALEPPGHDAWQPERYEKDESYAKKTLKKLYLWINENVRDLLRQSGHEEMDVEGMSQYLPDDMDELAPRDLDGEAEGIPSSPKEIEAVATEKAYEGAAAGAVAYAGAEAAVADDGSEGYVPVPESPGNASDGGLSHLEEHSVLGGGTDGSVPGDGGAAARTLKAVPLRNTRIFCTDPDSGTYSLSYEPETSGTGCLRLVIVGEEGDEPAPVLKAEARATGQKIGVRPGGVIGPVRFEAKTRDTLLVTLAEPLRCSLEVYGVAD